MTKGKDNFISFNPALTQEQRTRTLIEQDTIGTVTAAVGRRMPRAMSGGEKADISSYVQHQLNPALDGSYTNFTGIVRDYEYVITPLVNQARRTAVTAGVKVNDKSKINPEVEKSITAGPSVTPVITPKPTTSPVGTAGAGLLLLGLGAFAIFFLTRRRK